MSAIDFLVVETSLGPMLVAASEAGVCCVSFNETRDDLARRFPKAALSQGGGQIATLAGQVVDAVERPRECEQATMAIPLDISGTDFQRAVWRQLREIPLGETCSYGDIARNLGKPKAMRAVGGANGANRIAVLIPCHRVVQHNGSLGGYAYGDSIKRGLLEREAAGKRAA